jgi:hypothetical protein
MSTVKVMPSFLIKLMNLSRELPATKRKILADSIEKLATPVLDNQALTVLQKKLHKDDQARNDLSGKNPEDADDEVFLSAVQSQAELANYVQSLLESSKYSSFPAKKVLPMMKALNSKFNENSSLTSQSVIGTIDFYMGRSGGPQNYEHLFFSVLPGEQANVAKQNLGDVDSREGVFGKTPNERDDQYELDDDFVYPGVK